MQSLSKFIRISGPIPKVKKFSFVGLRGNKAPGKCFNLQPHLSLETVFPALEITHNSFVNIKISFS